MDFIRLDEIEILSIEFFCLKLLEKIKTCCNELLYNIQKYKKELYSNRNSKTDDER